MNGTSSGITPFWVDVENGNALDNVAKEAALRMLIVDIKNDDVNPASLADFADKVVPRGFFNETCQLLGLTGLVMMNKNGTRDPTYTVYGLDENYAQVALIDFIITFGVPVRSLRMIDE
ncbi:hypothetical protein KIN20_014423 [Parelaphostrongylus tenuis]|uniref:Uncharacterized protein n=1 Tax=Parelaphostrongylus tenuis TaxID=148309 RepID=A0AAD5N390_PARTN|nr:hypothetical protein KIN20_014423 [Parelaphostrongylus tenuis]